MGGIYEDIFSNWHQAETVQVDVCTFIIYVFSDLSKVNKISMCAGNGFTNFYNSNIKKLRGLNQTCLFGHIVGYDTFNSGTMCTSHLLMILDTHRSRPRNSGNTLQEQGAM